MSPNLRISPRLAALSLAVAICLAVAASPAPAKAPVLYSNPCPPEAVPARAGLTSPAPKSYWAVCRQRHMPAPRHDEFDEAGMSIFIVGVTGVVLAIAVGIVWPDVAWEETPPERHDDPWSRPETS